MSEAERGRKLATEADNSARCRDNERRTHMTDAARRHRLLVPGPGRGRAAAEVCSGLFAKARERLGFVPNVFRVYSFRPERLSAWFTHFRQLHEPTEDLSAADREMIAVVVSSANGCLYCLVAHGAALRAELGDPVLGERISYDWRRADLDPRRRPRSAPTPRSSRCARARSRAPICRRCSTSG